MSGLDGLRIAVTRQGPQAEQLCDRLRELGAVPVRVPTITVLPPESTARLDEALRSLDRFDWVVFTSANGVLSATARTAVLGVGPEVFARTRVAAIGPATSRALTDAGIAVAAMPDEYLTERITGAIEPGPGQRVLLLRADIASATLPRLLTERGVHVEDIAAYHTVSAVPDARSMAALREGVDVITFTSPSTVHGFVNAFGDDWQGAIGATLIASIGPVTSAAARELGFEVTIEAGEYTTDGLVRALCDHHAAHSESGIDT